MSKFNLTREEEIFLMILNEEKEGWHYLAVKKLSALLHGMTSEYKGNFYCFNWLHFLEKKNLNLMKKFSKVKIFVEL